MKYVLMCFGNGELSPCNCPDHFPPVISSFSWPESDHPVLSVNICSHQLCPWLRITPEDPPDTVIICLPTSDADCGTVRTARASPASTGPADCNLQIHIFILIVHLPIGGNLCSFSPRCRKLSIRKWINFIRWLSPFNNFSCCNLKHFLI